MLLIWILLLRRIHSRSNLLLLWWHSTLGSHLLLWYSSLRRPIHLLLLHLLLHHNLLLLLLHHQLLLLQHHVIVHLILLRITSSINTSFHWSIKCSSSLLLTKLSSITIAMIQGSHCVIIIIIHSLMHFQVRSLLLFEYLNSIFLCTLLCSTLCPTAFLCSLAVAETTEEK